MTKNRRWCAVSGGLVLASLLLAQWHSPYWMIVTVLVGLDLLQSGFTDRGFIAWLLESELEFDGVFSSVAERDGHTVCELDAEGEAVLEWSDLSAWTGSWRTANGKSASGDTSSRIARIPSKSQAP